MQSALNNTQRQEFCVRWNSHLGSIGAAFPQLLAGQRFVDVTLACEGSQIHCHRLVLAACSSYFESILAENPCKHPVIILPSEIKLWEIQALVDFMYKGEVNVTQTGLPQLLRCAEQLRIRGLYGSDAALNLNQLKAMTGKMGVTTAAAATAAGGHRVDPGGNQPSSCNISSGSGGGGGGGVQDNAIDTDENNSNNSTTTNTTTTTTAPSLMPQPQQQQLQRPPLITQQQQQRQQSQQQQHIIPMGQIKKEFIPIEQTNGSLQQHQQLTLQQQLLQQQMQQEAHIAASIMTSMQQVAAANSNAPTENDDDSGDDSASNQYEEYPATHLKQQEKQQLHKMQFQQISNKQQQKQQQQHAQQVQHESAIEDDHNYVAMHDEDDSYYDSNTTGMDTEHESSANSSLLIATDNSTSYKRVRRSEASLAQAAKCVSKGQTFQTVSNMFNIPVSTIRFYMARKGILPKRKRGRGASSANLPGASMNQALSAETYNNATVLAQSLTQLKRSDSPETTAAYHLMGYKQLNEQGAMI